MGKIVDDGKKSDDEEGLDRPERSAHFGDFERLASGNVALKRQANRDGDVVRMPDLLRWVEPSGRRIWEG